VVRFASSLRSSLNDRVRGSAGVVPGRWASGASRDADLWRGGAFRLVAALLAQRPGADLWWCPFRSL